MASNLLIEEMRSKNYPYKTVTNTLAAGDKLLLSLMAGCIQEGPTSTNMEVEETLSTKPVSAQLIPQQASQAQGPDSGHFQWESSRKTLLGLKRTLGPAWHTPHI